MSHFRKLLEKVDAADEEGDDMHMLTLAESAGTMRSNTLMQNLTQLLNDDIDEPAAASASSRAGRKRRRKPVESDDDDDEDYVDEDEVRAAAAELDNLADPLSTARNAFKLARTRDSSTRKRVTGLTKSGDLAPSVARLMGEANALFVANKVAETMAVLSSVVAAAPTHVPAHMLLSSLHEDRGDINKAYQAALVAFRSDNESSGYIARRIAGLARELKFLEHAADLYERASRLDPSDGASLLDAAALRVELGERKKAIRDYQRAMRLDNTHLSLPELSVRIAELAVAGRDRKTAVSALEDALNFCMGGTAATDAGEESKSKTGGKKRPPVAELRARPALALHATHAAHLLCEILAGQGAHVAVAHWCDRVQAYYKSASEALPSLPAYPVDLEAQHALALMRCDRRGDAVAHLATLAGAEAELFGDVMAEAAYVAATCGMLASAEALVAAMKGVRQEGLEFMRVTAAAAIVLRLRGQLKQAMLKFCELLPLPDVPLDMIQRLFQVVIDSKEFAAFGDRVIDPSLLALDDPSNAPGLAGVARQALHNDARSAAALTLARALRIIPPVSAGRASRFRSIAASMPVAPFLELIEAALAALTTDRADDARFMGETVSRLILKSPMATDSITSATHPNLNAYITAAQRLTQVVAAALEDVEEEEVQVPKVKSVKPRGKRSKRAEVDGGEAAAFQRQLESCLSHTGELDMAAMRALAGVVSGRKPWPTDADFISNYTTPSLQALASSEASLSKSRRLASLRGAEEEEEVEVEPEETAAAPIPLPHDDFGSMEDPYKKALHDVFHGLLKFDTQPVALLLAQRLAAVVDKDNLKRHVQEDANMTRRMERRVKVEANSSNVGMLAYLGAAYLKKGSYNESAWYYLQAWRLASHSPLLALATGAALMQCASSRTELRRGRIAFMALVAFLSYRRLRLTQDADRKQPPSAAVREEHNMLLAMCITCRLQCLPLELPPALIHREVNYNLGRACHTLNMPQAAIHFYEAALGDLPMHVSVDPSVPLPSSSSAASATSSSAAAADDVHSLDGPYAQFDMRREAAYNLATLLMDRNDRVRAREVTERFLRYD